MRSLLALICFSSLLFAAPVPKGKEKADAELILGMWEIVGDSDDGTLQNKNYNGVKWEFLEKNQARIWNPGDKAPAAVVYALDPTKKPKHFDWSFPGGEDRPEKINPVQFPSIYELEGDTLKVCFGRPETGRPVGLSTKNGQFTTLRRVVEKK